VKNSVYQKGKLIVLLLYIRRKKKLVLFTEIEHINHVMLLMTQSPKIYAIFIV
jgi:hypothetical protein